MKKFQKIKEQKKKKQEIFEGNLGGIQILGF